MKSEPVLIEASVLGLIFDNCPDLLALVDADGLFICANAAHLARMGRSPDSLLGTSFFDLLHAQDADRFAKAIHASARKRTPLRVVARWIHGSGEVLTFESLGKWVSTNNGQSQSLLLASREVSETGLASDASQAAEMQRDARLLLANSDAERNQLARAIHDDLGQKLTAMSIELSLWKTEVDGGASRSVGAIREKIAVLSELTNSVIAFTRRITATLRPRVLEEFGIVAALEWHLEKLQERTGTDCTFTAKPGRLQLGPATAAQVFRITEEITKSLAAECALMELRLEKRPNDVLFRLTTDLTRIDVLPEVAARIHVLGGELTANRGSLTVTLPLRTK